jgi:3'-5' exoribonuclease
MSDEIRIRDLCGGQPVKAIFLLQSRTENRGKTGKAYLQLTLSDASGTIGAKAWRPEIVPEEAACKPVRVTGRVDEYQGALQIIVDQVEILDERDVPVERLLPASRYSFAELDARLTEVVERIQNPWIRRLLEEMLAEGDTRARLLRAPAAHGIHHAYLGGLLEHALSMAAAFEGLRGHYEAYYPGLLDGDLVLAGILLHDLGKIDEIGAGSGFDYTDPGRLLGHIAIGAERAARAAARLDGFPIDVLMRVQHLVLAHHGELEYGSPVRPRLAEAVLLHYLDQIDAKLNHAWTRVQEAPAGATWTAQSKIFEGPLLIPEAARSARPALASPPAAGKARTRKEEASLKLFPDD